MADLTGTLMAATGDPFTPETVSNIFFLANHSFVPGRDGLQRIVTLYVLFGIKKTTSGCKFEPTLTKVLKKIPKREGPCAPGLFCMLSVLPLSLLPGGRESRAMGHGRREQEEGLGGFMAMSALGLSTLLGPLSLLGIHNPILLPI